MVAHPMTFGHSTAAYRLAACSRSLAGAPLRGAANDSLAGYVV